MAGWRLFFFAAALLVAVAPLPQALGAYAALDRTPTEWLEDHLAMREANGWKVEQIFSDVIAIKHPTHPDAIEYFFKMEGDPQPWSKWRQADWDRRARTAYAGVRYPAPRKPLERMSRGWMLYEGRIAPRLSHEEGFTREDQYKLYAEKREIIFKTLQEQGINAVIYLTYMTPDMWPEMQRHAAQYDIDVVLQNIAYFHPTARPDLWNDPVAAQRIRQSSLDFLEAIHEDGGEKHLLGFSIREEPYLPFLGETQNYHDLQREAFPDLTIFMLYNRPDAMRATRQPAPEVMPHNTSEFLGAFTGPAHRIPASRTPQEALLANANRLTNSSHAALAKGSVYAYIPVLAGWMMNFSAEDAEKYGWPTENYFGVQPIPDGRIRYWRNYTAPPGATRAAMWNSVAEGAQGWFPWSGQTGMPWLPPEEVWFEHPNADPMLVRVDQRPVWREYLDTLEELTPWEPLLLQLRRDGMPRVYCEDPLVIATGHRLLFEDDDSRVLTLVNLDTGRWPGYPMNDRTTTENLEISPTGELLGYEQLKEPREIEFMVRMRDGERLYDLRSKELIEPDGISDEDHHVFTRPIEPGGAGLFFVGTEATWEKTQEVLP